MASGVDLSRGNTLTATIAAHLAVLRLEDLPHPPLADRVDDQIGAEVELRAAVEQLLRLPDVQQAHLDQPVGKLLVAGRGVRIGLVPLRPAHARPGLVELLLRQQTAGHGTLLKRRPIGTAHWRIDPRTPDPESDSTSTLARSGPVGKLFWPPVGIWSETSSQFRVIQE